MGSVLGRVVIIFEGRGAAGKGVPLSVLGAFNPRYARISIALQPSWREVDRLGISKICMKIFNKRRNRLFYDRPGITVLGVRRL